MPERIKELRKYFNLTQTEFGQKIGLTRDSVANIEGGRAEIKDIYFISICREFKVNEEWLRDGTGQMFVEQKKDIEIANLLGDVMRSDKTDFKRRLIAALAKLDSDGWKQIEDLIDSIAGK